MGSEKTAYKKKEWLDKVFSKASSQGTSINRKKLIALFCLEHNSTPRTANEMIDTFINAGKIKQFENELMDPKLYEEMKSNNFNEKETMDDSRAEFDSALSNLGIDSSTG